MTATNISQRTPRALQPDPSTHLYAMGQAVRLKAGFFPSSKIADIFHITGILPPRNEMPQYRIRSDGERHERVATQDILEPVSPVPTSDNVTLLERTFDHG